MSTKFMGASVTNFSSSVGWNEQASIVTVNLVEDPVAGDVFTPPTIGSPIQFVCSGFTFHGLFQSYERKNSFGEGNPVYTVTVVSPNELLEGVTVILSSFNGAVSNVPNIINAFGYWETTLGFGGAMVNDSGMLWNAPFSLLNLNTASHAGSITINTVGEVGIMIAVQTLTVTGNGYGGPIQFRGSTYNVDLSGLPATPSYYRLGGVSQTLRELVTQLCQDSGYDYICYLSGTTIKFNCVSRLNQPLIGQIATFIASQSNIPSKRVGVELRNDYTNAVLIGGDQEYLTQIYNINLDDTIWPYWDVDANNNIIYGTGQPEATHEFYLNATPIADIMGSTQYHCTIEELRFAASEKGFDSWAAWVMRQEPDKAQTINLVGAIDASSDLFTIFGADPLARDPIAADMATVNQIGGMYESNYWTDRAQRVFEFVKHYATDYLGKKFLVKLPFLIYWQQVPDSTTIIASDQPVQSGYLSEGSQPLGLGFLNEDIFMDSSGKFECFCCFSSNVGNYDISRLSPGSYFVQSGTLYVKASVDLDMGVVYPPGSSFPYCVINLSEAVYEVAPDPLGGIDDIAVAMGYDINNTTPFHMMEAFRSGDFPIQITPSCYRPDSVAIPMKSNRMSYGPWGTFSPWGTVGVAGKTFVQRDESFTPWEYGDLNTLNLAATAKLSSMTTNMQESEYGSVEVVGLPTLSLGDALVAGGPNVTGINVSISTQGITTNYEMRTFTRVFGAFSREYADRLKKLGIASNQVRMSLRNLFHRRDANQILAYRVQTGFMENASRAVNQMTPHDILYGRMTLTDKFGYRTQCSTSTYPEAIANTRGDNANYWQYSAAMSMEGLLRPFSTNWTTPGAQPGIGDIPHYGTMDGSIGVGTGTMPCIRTLDPFASGHDIDILAWNQTYPGEMNVKKSIYLNQNPPSGWAGSPPAYGNTRPLGLRSPLVLVGYGYDYTGKPFPNEYLNPAIASGFTGPLPSATPYITRSNQFMTDYRKHPEFWQSGPVALHYDYWRQVWTVPTILKGQLVANVANGGSGTMNVYAFGNPIVNNGVTDQICVYHDLGGTVTSGVNVVATYYQMENRWYITSCACPPS